MKSITPFRSFLYLSLFICIVSHTEGRKTDQRQQVNILWLVAEDLSPYMPPFGDSTIRTPNLSRLAAEGVRYTNVFSVSGVCAPSRAALATGMYPSSIGAHNMRTLNQQAAAKEKGLINYECVPPPHIKMVSEILREHHYYCTNNSKQDYQFQPSKMAWDESSVYAHWRNRPIGKSFFSIFNFNVTHESNIWNPRYWAYNLDAFPPDRNLKNWRKQFQGVNKPLFVSENLEVEIPPYLPSTELVVDDIRRMYSNVVEMDRQVGLILRQLEEDGLLDHTIIVWYTDHGGPLPRQKRLCYDSGLKVPMIIRYPDRKGAGTIDDQLISFVDFAPTLLSMADIQPPDYLQGRAFAGPHASHQKRNYIHAAGDRFDEHYDMIRVVRDKRFKYLNNYQPEKGYYLAVEYRERMATMQELLRLRDEGKLNDAQMQWFRNSKPEEELFDTENDPHELFNLADDPRYTEVILGLRSECNRWTSEIDDMGLIPETELIERFWPDKKQPHTSMPKMEGENGRIKIVCATPGASIGYKFSGDQDPSKGWAIYQQPIDVPEGQSLKVIAHRIGYAPSDTLVVKN